MLRAPTDRTTVEVSDRTFSTGPIPLDAANVLRSRRDRRARPVIRRLRSFHRRRIAIPVTSADLVLDIGSGDKPHWRADVLLDRYLGAEHAAQRAGAAGAILDRPIFDADASAMPFADRSFDYAICAHVLEHVTDPGAVIAELLRVARAGYIEVPHAGACKINDFPSHLWWCRLDEGCLVLEGKQGPSFDRDIDAFVRSGSVGRDLQRLLVRNFDDMVLSIPWKGSVDHRVVGAPAVKLLADAHDPLAGVHHRSSETVVARALGGALQLPYRGRRRRTPVMFNSVVRPEHRIRQDEPLRQMVYRLT